MTRTRLGLRLTLMICLGILVLAGCGEKDEPKADDGAAHKTTAQQQPTGKKAGGQQGTPGSQQPAGGHNPGGPGKHPGAGEQPAVPVAVQTATTGSISSYYRATATLEPQKQAQILARATGVVGTLHAEEGDQVQSGAVLLVIENAEYRFKVDQAEANTANLRSRFHRLEQMRAEELATMEEFEAARSDLASAEAEEGLARLNLSYTSVVAPFGGAVTERLVDPGQNVNIGDPLFVMADFTPLLARVHVPSREFNQLQRDQAVELVLDSDGTRLAGHIKLISPIIDPNSGTIKITVEVAEYPAGTRPGDFAQVQIVTERREGAVLVPRGAVLTDKGEQVVYTVIRDDDGPAAERRVVTVGFTNDEHTQVLSGLAADEPVVTKGQRSLKHGMKLKILEGPGVAR